MLLPMLETQAEPVAVSAALQSARRVDADDTLKLGAIQVAVPVHLLHKILFNL
jgi:hypothetical protein